LKEEALDRIMWRARFGRGTGPVVRQTTKWITWIRASGCFVHYEELSSLIWTRNLLISIANLSFLYQKNFCLEVFR
jgi:hypothetical protein